MQRTLAVACVFVVAAVAPGAALAATDLAQASPQTTPQEGEPLVQEEQPTPDNTITRIDLTADGSATWTLQFRTRLPTDGDVDDFERFQASFRANTSRYLDPFRERMTGVVANAANTTGREMRATGFEASTSVQEVPQRWGIVTYRFEWTGFAATDGDRVIVGDIFDGGFFISDDDVLEVVIPGGYDTARADPTPDETTDTTVEWRGREDFADARPRVVAVPSSTAPPADDEAGEGGTGGGTDWLPFAAGVSLLALVAVALYARQARADGSAGEPETGGATGSEAQPTAEDGSGQAPPAAAGPSGADGPDLVTDEDRVRQLLAERGGRMKQSEIVDALGWSKSKTSRVLSGMADEGTISKLRIGRENVIDLEDDERN